MRIVPILSGLLLFSSLQADNITHKDGLYFDMGLSVNKVNGEKISAGLVKDTGISLKIGLGYDKLVTDKILLGGKASFIAAKFMFDSDIIEETNSYYTQDSNFYGLGGYALAFKAGMVFDRFTPYAKLAYEYIGVAGPEENPITDYSFSGFGPGLGFDYQLSNSSKIGFDYTLFNVKGDIGVIKSDPSTNHTFSLNYGINF